MSPHAYTEDQLVERPAVGLFAELGWQTVAAMEEVFEGLGTLRSSPVQPLLEKCTSVKVKRFFCTWRRNTAIRGFIN
jgi:hypothetical protein